MQMKCRRVCGSKRVVKSIFLCLQLAEEGPPLLHCDASSRDTPRAQHVKDMIPYPDIIETSARQMIDYGINIIACFHGTERGINYFQVT